jgi:hypothetical protein
MVKKIKESQTHKTVKAMGLPGVAKKIKERSYQRGGVVKGGTLLISSAKRVTPTSH